MFRFCQGIGVFTRRKIDVFARQSLKEITRKFAQSGGNRLYRINPSSLVPLLPVSALFSKPCEKCGLTPCSDISFSAILIFD